MAIPLQSLSGTEVLRRGGINAQSGVYTSLKFDGGITTPGSGNQAHVVPATHIITVTSIIFCEQANAIQSFYIWIHDGANDINIMSAQSCPAYGTFVWNDNITLVGGDKLIVTGNTGNFDVFYSYIDQSWV